MQKKSSKKNKRKNWRLLIFFSQQVLCLVAITVLSFFITIDWSIIIAFCVCIILGVILVLIDKEKILVDKG
ncbi:MAG: hypothetical protein LBV22_03120, partial [Mycoplasmataceae bacterium]|nr:hypothetical protein [Mycoplasmataceae bacterium]